MKKKYLLGLLVIVVCFVLVGCVKKEQTELDKIAKKFNNCETVKSYKKYGYKMKASVNGNKLTILMKTGGEKNSVSYNLVGSVLSNDKLKDEDLMTAIILIDSIGQLHGYKDGELAENLNAFPDEVNKYTLDSEGFEFKDNNGTSSIKVDISKKIPLIDLSRLYLKPDDFDMIKELVKDNSPGNQTGKIAKLSYDIQVTDEYNYIYIGERDKLTNSAYKSILSALEVMYGTEISNKFESLYPSFKDKKITIDEFTIDTNYKMDVEDESIFKDMKVVLVTINNSTIKK